MKKQSNMVILKKRFQIADKCVKSGCKQWTGGRGGDINGLSSGNPFLYAVDNQALPA
jgi:hypothetical protein